MLDANKPTQSQCQAKWFFHGSEGFWKQHLGLVAASMWLLLLRHFDQITGGIRLCGRRPRRTGLHVRSQEVTSVSASKHMSGCHCQGRSISFLQLRTQVHRETRCKNLGFPHMQPACCTTSDIQPHCRRPCQVLEAPTTSSELLSLPETLETKMLTRPKLKARRHHDPKTRTC